MSSIALRTALPFDKDKVVELIHRLNVFEADLVGDRRRDYGAAAEYYDELMQRLSRRNGRIVLAEPMTSLQERFRRVEVTLTEMGVGSGDIGPAGAVAAPDASWIGLMTAGRLVRFTHTAYDSPMSSERLSARFPGARIEVEPMSLRQIFVALVRQRRAHQETSHPAGVQEAAR
jgi:hypothetical protein